MNRHGRETITGQGLEQIGRQALVSAEGAVKVFALGNLVKQLANRARPKAINVLDLPLALERGIVRHGSHRATARRRRP